MRLLALIRHGSYDYGETGLRDVERALDEGGQRDAGRIGRELAEAGFEPDRIVSGAAARTLETARIVAAQLSLPDDVIEVREDLYHASRERLLAVLRALPDELFQVALVGHHPGLTELATLLTDRRVAAIPFCGVAWMELEVDAWASLGHGSALNVQRFEPG